MNKLVIAATLIAISSFSLAGANADKRMQRMIEKLELSEEQVSQVETIMTNQQARRDEIREQMQALRADTRSQMSAILTDEQLEKFDRMQQHKKHKRDKFQAMRDG